MCPATFAFDVIGKKWNLPILSVLTNNKSVRYNELKRLLPGITGTMLTNCLKELTEHGIVHREQYFEIPPRVEYSLTKSGEELAPIIESIVVWGRNNIEMLQDKMK
ncbi:helix-turn-helix transcriptional regulator [Paenibacillus oenotherae]|uniref:Helix-turn-helix transcriptional regulator n=2 Tax=Paenibacillus oenotherae TaxID=1435645 RepID=A0ABS7D5S7_9BACL|nr:helix-turn-helix domain-containing protein [Paenibacillus oenotherae]MBW7475295.1 helix-turn-helix transcriptional regulator [Paenibacillus oenotherae]